MKKLDRKKLFKQAIEELDEWDFENKVADTYLRTEHDLRIANKIIDLVMK